jgi:hypothetical protein
LFTAKRSLSPKPSISKPENSIIANGPRVAATPKLTEKLTETAQKLISSQKSSPKSGSKLISELKSELKSNPKPVTTSNQSLPALPATSWLPLPDDEDDETAALMMDVEESTQPEESTLEEEDSINRPKILQETTIPKVIRKVVTKSEKIAEDDGKSRKTDAKSDETDPKLTKKLDHAPPLEKSAETSDSKPGNSLSKSPTKPTSSPINQKLDLSRTVASDAFKKILETSLQNNAQLQSDKITEFLNKSKANAQSQLNSKNKSERSSRKSSRAATPTGDLDMVLKNLVSGKLSPRGSSTGGSNTPSVVGTEEMAKKQAIPTSKQFQFGAPAMKVSSVVEEGKEGEKPKATRARNRNPDQKRQAPPVSSKENNGQNKPEPAKRSRKTEPTLKTAPKLNPSPTPTTTPNGLHVQQLAGSDDTKHEPVLEDYNCWLCHKGGELLCCDLCCRVYHSPCLNMKVFPTGDWFCPECDKIATAENGQNSRAVLMYKDDKQQMQECLLGITTRLKHDPNALYFLNPVDVKLNPDYPKYVVYPMCMQMIEEKVKKRGIKSPAALLSECKWILHNCIVFNGNNAITAICKRFLKIAEVECYACDISPPCYIEIYKAYQDWCGLPAAKRTYYAATEGAGKTTLADSVKLDESKRRPKTKWFTRVNKHSIEGETKRNKKIMLNYQTLPQVHPIVWAKMQGFPYWPAKLMNIKRVPGQKTPGSTKEESEFQAECRFFGEHDWGTVPLAHIFNVSKDSPAPFSKGKKKGLDEAMSEMKEYSENIEKKFGGFYWYPQRTMVDLESCFLLKSITKGPTKTPRSKSPNGENSRSTTPDFSKEKTGPGNLNKLVNRKRNESGKSDDKTDEKHVAKIMQNAENDPKNGSIFDFKPDKLEVKKEKILEAKKLDQKTAAKTAPKKPDVAKAPKIPESISKSILANLAKPSDNIKSVIDKLKDAGVKPAPYQERANERESRLQKRQEIEDKAKEDAKKPKLKQETLEEKIVRVRREKKADKRKHDEKVLKQKEIDSLFNVEATKETKDAIRTGAYLKPKDKLKVLKSELDTARKSSKDEEEISKNQTKRRKDKNRERSDSENLSTTSGGDSPKIHAKNPLKIPESPLVQSDTTANERQFVRVNSQTSTATDDMDTSEGNITTAPSSECFAGVNQSVESMKEQINREMRREKKRKRQSALQASGGVRSSLPPMAQQNGGRVLSNPADETVGLYDSERFYQNPLQSDLPHPVDAVFNLSKYQTMLMTTVRTCLRGMYSDYGSNPNNLNLNNSFAAQLHPLLNGSTTSIDPSNPENSDHAALNGTLPNSQNLPNSHPGNNPEDPGGMLNGSLLNASQIERGGGGGDAVQVAQALRMEMERMNWKHQAEVDEMQFNHELSLKEFKASQEIKNQKVLQDERERWEGEKQRTVENVKRKQWCSMCTKEALFYCCWNTSYCGDICQREHWGQHSSQCTQIRQAEQQAAAAVAGNAGSMRTSSINNSANSPANQSQVPTPNNRSNPATPAVQMHS